MDRYHPDFIRKLIDAIEERDGDASNSYRVLGIAARYLNFVQHGFNHGHAMECAFFVVMNREPHDCADNLYKAGIGYTYPCDADHNLIDDAHRVACSVGFNNDWPQRK